MFYFGVDYYPEHWPVERWQVDASMMAEAGMNVVRMAEFAWAKLEKVTPNQPDGGIYDFTWLDKAIDILHSHDIKTILGTPTASPPSWMMVRHPELFRVGPDGNRLTYGNRREYCPNNPLYHQKTRDIVSAMAHHYAGHPAIIGWQIDNEFGDRCYCPVCQNKFQEWLQKRYQSLDTLNELWGTIFWSHVYTEWSHIPVPVTTGRSPNPGLALDYARFMSDSYVAYQQLQIDILKELCPDHIITHNFMGFNYDRLNYFDLSTPLDIVAWDNYPLGFRQQDPANSSRPALGHDTMRGLKKKNFWVMEKQAGPSGWETISMSSRPGQLRLWAYQAIAHGADAVIFFRWRTARHGTEQYWHGLLDHHGNPGRRYTEIKQMGSEISGVSSIIEKAETRAKAAILLDYDSRFAFQIQSNSQGFHYPEHIKSIYDAFFLNHVPVDIIAPTSDLSSYKLIFAPAIYVLKEEIVDNLKNFANQGGTLVITPRTGVKDKSNAVINIPLPGLLAELCGVTVEEYTVLPDFAVQEIEFVLPALSSSWPPQARIWSDILTPNTAQVIAFYTRDYYAGKPAITMNHLGSGQVIYVGTFGDTSLYLTLLSWLLAEKNIRGTYTVPEGVEVTERWQNEQRIIFILNHTDTAQTITLPRQYTNLMDGQTISGYISLPAYDILIFMESE